MSLISKIQSLISSANAVTGESRTDLTSAVQDLKDGYGGSTVEKGLVFSEYDSDGYPHKAEIVGMTVIPTNYLSADGLIANTLISKITNLHIPSFVQKLDSGALGSKWLETVTFDNGVTSIRNYVFRESAIQELTIPQSVTAVGVDTFGYARQLADLTFLGDITAVARYGFEYAGSQKSQLTIDFSHCTGVPTLENANAFYVTGAKVFKVPSALLSEWQTATNWVGVTNVTWQGV